MNLRPLLSLVLFLFTPAHSLESDETNQVVFQISSSGFEAAYAPSDAATRTCVASSSQPTSGSAIAAATAISTGLPTHIDSSTPSSELKRTSKQGLEYVLTWSEEFVMDGREFGFGDDHSDCDDPKWERTRPDPVPHWELTDLTEDEFDAFEELDPNFSSSGLDYVYLYGDGDISEAANRAKCYNSENGDDNISLEVEDVETTFSIAPPPSELTPQEGEPLAIILLRPYAAGWSVFAPLNKRGGRELIATREPICVPVGGFVEVGVVVTGLPNVQHFLRRVIFWPGQPLTSLDKYSWKLVNDSISGWDFDSDIILDLDTGEVPSLEADDVESTGFLPYRFPDMQVSLGLPTETGDVDYVRVYAPAYIKSHGVKPFIACDEKATGRPVAEQYLVVDLAHVRGL